MSILAYSKAFACATLPARYWTTYWYAHCIPRECLCCKCLLRNTFEYTVHCFAQLAEVTFQDFDLVGEIIHLRTAKMPRLPLQNLACVGSKTWRPWFHGKEVPEVCVLSCCWLVISVHPLIIPRTASFKWVSHWHPEMSAKSVSSHLLTSRNDKHVNTSILMWYNFLPICIEDATF